jgi:hypothetical protein
MKNLANISIGGETNCRDQKPLAFSNRLRVGIEYLKCILEAVVQEHLSSRTGTQNQYILI